MCFTYSTFVFKFFVLFVGFDIVGFVLGIKVGRERVGERVGIDEIGCIVGLRDGFELVGVRVKQVSCLHVPKHSMTFVPPPSERKTFQILGG